MVTRNEVVARVAEATDALLATRVQAVVLLEGVDVLGLADLDPLQLPRHAVRWLLVVFVDFDVEHVQEFGVVITARFVFGIVTS